MVSSTFVIQQDPATTDGYHLRLQIGESLKSWAIPKGLLLDPKERRLAVEREESSLHNVGVGAVVLPWDQGILHNRKRKSLQECYNEGRIEINLCGEKIRGGYSLVRFRPEQKQWLLLKIRDYS